MRFMPYLFTISLSKYHSAMNESPTEISPARHRVPNHILLEEVRRQLAAGHTASFRVYGNSMRPFLESGRDKVLLAPPPARVEVGEVALVLSDDGHYVLHRVVAVGADGDCTLWGDGNARGREHCTAQNVIGVAQGFWRADRYYACSDPTWQRYSRWWMRLAPLRRYLLAAHRLAIKCHLIKI
jgi:hypothetical protein